MRIQDETDCHLSRLSRSLMTRTAFGRSYASRPGTWHRLQPLLFPLFSAFLLFFRVPLSFPSSLHRFAAIIVFPASFSTLLTCLRDG